MRFYTVILLLLAVTVTKAQDRADSIRRARAQQFQQTAGERQKSYFRRQFKGDTVKALQVEKILQDYKRKMKEVSANTAMTEDAKRAQYQSLIDDKNRKLKSLLSLEELKKIVPSTERPEKN